MHEEFLSLMELLGSFGDSFWRREGGTNVNGNSNAMENGNGEKDWSTGGNAGSISEHASSETKGESTQEGG